MQRLIWLVLLTLINLTSPSVALAQVTENWTIDSFHSDVVISQDARVMVTETIIADFGAEQKHGIFRVIPTTYRTKYSNNLNIRLKILGVRDENQNPIKYEESWGDGTVTLKIGHPDIYVSGKQIYVIAYRVDNAITKPTERAELYWNVTGNRWPVAIIHASSTVTAPDGSVLNSICFAGPIGSENQNCSKTHTNSRAEFSVTELGYGSGLTIAVALDQSLLLLPSRWKEYWWFLQDNWIVALPFITLILIGRLYWTAGRDKQYRQVFNESEPVSVPLFERLNALTVFGPPKNLSPGEVGVVVDEKVHMRDITAVIVDLARRGFFRVKEITKKGLFSANYDYELNLSDKSEEGLKAYEKKVLDMLFGMSRKKSVKMSALPEGAYEKLSEAMSELYEHVTKEGFFSGSPKKVRSFYVGLGVSLLVLAFFQAGIMSRYFNPLISGLAVFGSGLIILVFAPFMPARTAKGRRALQEVVGLKEWIRIGAWREQIHEKHLFLEEVLPYTIVFGLTQKFIQAFKAADLKKISWYESNRGFDGMHFGRSISSFGESFSSGIAKTRPSGSSFGGFSSTGASRGGSGFSGGSSGGGFGGGGGGSW